MVGERPGDLHNSGMRNEGSIVWANTINDEGINGTPSRSIIHSSAG